MMRHDATFDLKYQVMEMRMRDPFDLLGGTFEFLGPRMDSDLVWLCAIGSYPVTLRSGRILEHTDGFNFGWRVDINSYDDTTSKLALTWERHSSFHSTEAIGNCSSTIIQVHLRSKFRTVVHGLGQISCWPSRGFGISSGFSSALVLVEELLVSDPAT
jgi:hypothetical protein